MIPSRPLGGVGSSQFFQRPRIGIQRRAFVSPLLRPQLEREKIPDLPSSNTVASLQQDESHTATPISIDTESRNISQGLSTTSSFGRQAFKPPLPPPPIASSRILTNQSVPQTYSEQLIHTMESKKEELQDWGFEVMFTNVSTKKHKNWEDGFLQIQKRTYTLFDKSGKVVTKLNLNENPAKFCPGSTLQLFKKEIEFVQQIPFSEIKSGRVFLTGGYQSPTIQLSSSVSLTRPSSSGSGAFVSPLRRPLSMASSLPPHSQQPSTLHTGPLSLRLIARPGYSSALNNSPTNISSSLRRGIVSAQPALSNTPLADAVIINKDHPPVDAHGRKIFDIVIDPSLLFCLNFSRSVLMILFFQYFTNLLFHLVLITLHHHFLYPLYISFFQSFLLCPQVSHPLWSPIRSSVCLLCTAASAVAKASRGQALEAAFLQTKWASEKRCSRFLSCGQRSSRADSAQNSCRRC